MASIPHNMVLDIWLTKIRRAAMKAKIKVSNSNRTSGCFIVDHITNGRSLNRKLFERKIDIHQD